MTDSMTSTYRRVVRRETHSPRSVLAITIAIVVIAACVLLVVELVLEALGQRALTAAPRDAIGFLADLTDVAPALLTAAGMVIAVIGVILVVAALSPGRTARHSLASDRSAVVVDNQVIAAAIARRAADAAMLGSSQVSASVSHREAVVSVTPASGLPVDTETVRSAVQGELDSLGLSPAVRLRVAVDRTGKVGA